MRKLFSVKTLSLIVFAILIMFVITCFVLTIRPLKSVHAETAIETSAASGETETGDTGETTPSDTDETTPPDSSDTDKTLEEENKEPLTSCPQRGHGMRGKLFYKSFLLHNYPFVL